MDLLTATQLRAADALTCQSANLSSLDLMERAAAAATADLRAHLPYANPGRVVICCGPGNNGGDGLAVARQLLAAPPADDFTGYPSRRADAEAAPVPGLADRPFRVAVYYLAAEHYSPDWLANRERLPAAVTVVEMTSEADFPPLDAHVPVIDALFGTGLNRPLTGLAAALVRHLNAGPAPIYALDVPSGLLTDAATPPDAAVIEATQTLTFQAPKLPFLLPATAGLAGQWRVLDIGLDLSQTTPTLHLTYPADVAALLRPRARFAHKGTYGHALLLAGARGKLGAAVLAARACLRAGVGLLTVQVPAVGYGVLQTAVPEAMTLTDPMADYLSLLAGPDGLAPYRALGIGPGLGQHPDTALLLREVLEEASRRDVAIVLDADALNLLAQHPQWLNHLPPRTVLTPHPKEFERLAGPATDDFHRLDLLRAFCARHGCHVVLKGAYSVIGTPHGHLYFNSTGNPGMATGGTGDVLTGVVLGLLAEGLAPFDAARLGVLAHGQAGDLARDAHGERGLTAGDVADHVGRAFQALAFAGDFPF